MPAIDTNASGDYIFAALENGSGFPVVVKAARTTLNTWTAAWNPGAGTAANVLKVPSNDDLMLFYGDFGSGVKVIQHTISTGNNTDISPTGLTTKVVNTLAVNPSDENEMFCTVDTDQDLHYSDDGGATWTVLNNALGFNPTALNVLWSGAYAPHRLFVAGNDGADTILFYSPNDGGTLVDQADVNLAGQANIASLDTVEA